RLEIDGRTPGGIGGGFRGVFVGSRSRREISFCRLSFGAWIVLDFVYLAIGSGGGIDRACGANLQGLYLEFLGLENNGSFTIPRDAVHASRRACRYIYISRVVGRDCPNVG